MDKTMSIIRYGNTYVSQYDYNFKEIYSTKNRKKALVNYKYAHEELVSKMKEDGHKQKFVVEPTTKRRGART
ncbi:hypothetical protein HB904_04330 [Listeria booriae]|uniref:Uncharacterized protein n=1 Tax=Listeria booriae TaxID=1552123 RepID=A0A842AI75_9LIST|nr:hypothetical protein [Listeria booriae]MBC1615401.1 hypothetical protein [Listeria booriae]